MIDIPTLMTFMVGVITAIIGLQQLRNLVRNRQAQLFMNLYDAFYSKDFQKQYAEILFRSDWKDFEDWQKKYGPIANIDEFSYWVSVPAYFEGVGVLVKRKLIDISLVDDLLSTEILFLWEKILPITKEYRAQLNRPQLWEYFEELYNQMKKREKK